MPWDRRLIHTGPLLAARHGQKDARWQLGWLTSIFVATASSLHKYFLTFHISRTANIFFFKNVFSHFLARSLRILSTVLKKKRQLKARTTPWLRTHTLQTYRLSDLMVAAAKDLGIDPLSIISKGLWSDPTLGVLAAWDSPCYSLSTTAKEVSVGG